MYSSNSSQCQKSNIVTLWYLLLIKMKNMHLVVLCIYPDIEHWNCVLRKLEIFWTMCILPEILGWWYTQRCQCQLNYQMWTPSVSVKWIEMESILCSNEECHYKGFHPSCLSLTSVKMPKRRYCCHRCRLPQFKKRRYYKGIICCIKSSSYEVWQHLYLQVKPFPTDKIVECYGEGCNNGKFFTCLV